jgi:hypothetical protein
MPKPIDLTISFKLPKGVKFANASIQPGGEIILTDDEGNTFTPELMERKIGFPREKGPKIQSRNKVFGKHLSVGGLKEFTKYDSVFFIDTNKRLVNGEEVAAACFINCQFITSKDQIRIVCDEKLNIYEFHNIPKNVKNPETLAILKIARDITKISESNMNLNVAVVTDTELGSHDEINARKTPIFKNHLLPAGLHLHYASTDTGREVINRMLKFCDKQSSLYLKYLEEDSVKKSDLKQLAEDPSVQYRYMFRNDIELVNPVVGGISIPPGTKVSLYGVKGPHKK